MSGFENSNRFMYERDDKLLLNEASILITWLWEMSVKGQAMQICLWCCVDNAPDNNTEAEEWAAGSGDCGVGLGQHGANNCAGEHGTRWRRCTLQSAQRRWSDHVSQWSQPCRTATVYMPELCQGTNCTPPITLVHWFTVLVVSSSCYSTLLFWLHASVLMIIIITRRLYWRWASIKTTKCSQGLLVAFQLSSMA